MNVGIRNVLVLGVRFVFSVNHYSHSDTEVMSTELAWSLQVLSVLKLEPLSTCYILAISATLGTKQTLFIHH